MKHKRMLGFGIIIIIRMYLLASIQARKWYVGLGTTLYFRRWQRCNRLEARTVPASELKETKLQITTGCNPLLREHRSPLTSPCAYTLMISRLPVATYVVIVSMQHTLMRQHAYLA